MKVTKADILKLKSEFYFRLSKYTCNALEFFVSYSGQEGPFKDLCNGNFTRRSCCPIVKAIQNVDLDLVFKVMKYAYQLPHLYQKEDLMIQDFNLSPKYPVKDVANSLLRYNSNARIISCQFNSMVSC